MTINNSSRTAGPFPGNGVTTVFPFSYKVFTRDDLLVARTVTATGVETILVLDSDYTVTLNANQNSSPGGTITMLVAPPVGTTLAATSDVDYTQTLDLTNGGGFFPTAINSALDRLVIQIQQLGAKVGIGMSVGLSAAVASVINFITNLAAAGGSALVGFLQAGTGAQAQTLQDAVRVIVSVKNFGAKGDGVTNDWQACQEAHDYLASIGGGTLLFPPGIYRIMGNTIVVWGSHIELSGYGATIYKDNAGGSAGEYGEAIAIYGKRHNTNYYSPQVAGTYAAKANYAGANVPSRVVSIKGFKVTFGTHNEDTINGIAIQNVENVTVQDCEVIGAPQTSFAAVGAGTWSCDGVTYINCISDGAKMQAFRAEAYGPDQGEIYCTYIDCASDNTTLTVAVPEPEQEGLASSLFARSSGTDTPFYVSVDSCEFDAAMHVRQGFNMVHVKNSRLDFLRGYCGVEGKQEIILDNCRIRSYLSIAGNVSQINLESRSIVYGSNFVMRGCTLEDPPTNNFYTIYAYGHNLDISDCAGLISHYITTYSSSYLNSCRIKACHITAVPSLGNSYNQAGMVEYDQCTFDYPVRFGGSCASFEVRNSLVNVGGSHLTYCFTYAGGPNTVGRFTGNIINYLNTAFATILVAELGKANVLENQYVYGGVRSYDISRGGAIPVAGYWQVGSVVINSVPTVGSPRAWVCTVAGAPGTWVSLGVLGLDQATHIGTTSGATLGQLETNVNALITAMITAKLMA